MNKQKLTQNDIYMTLRNGYDFVGRYDINGNVIGIYRTNNIKTHFEKYTRISVVDSVALRPYGIWEKFGTVLIAHAVATMSDDNIEFHLFMSPNDVEKYVGVFDISWGVEY